MKPPRLRLIRWEIVEARVVAWTIMCRSREAARPDRPMFAARSSAAVPATGSVGSLRFEAEEAAPFDYEFARSADVDSDRIRPSRPTLLAGMHGPCRELI